MGSIVIAALVHHAITRVRRVSTLRRVPPVHQIILIGILLTLSVAKIVLQQCIPSPMTPTATVVQLDVGRV